MRATRSKSLANRRVAVPSFPNALQRIHDYDIRLKADGTPILFTWYKGHAFDGWISEGNCQKAETDGVLSWAADGSPIVTIPTSRESPAS
jgi:hypothetical protein